MSGSYSVYSISDDDDDYSDSDSSERKRKKKKKDKKDKKGRKKEKKKHKKDKKKKEKKEKKEKKRRRSASSSRSQSRRRSRSRCRGSNRGRSPPRRQPSPRQSRPQPQPMAMPHMMAMSMGMGMMGMGMMGMPPMAGMHMGRGRSPPPMMAAPRSPMKLPEGRPFTLAETCEAAGRGITSGKTAQDDDVKVFDQHEQPYNADRYMRFDDAVEFPRELREELKRAGFPAPSQIQAYTWPLGVRGKDIIGIAATGSGKTLAFLLPAFTQMLDDNLRPERDGPGLLVMSPTRELAQQTEAEANRFGKCLGFRCVAMYGGSPKQQQMSKYRAGVHTIVACPGRLNDFLEGGQVRLEHVRKLVLDEADRMLDMGFEPQIRKILAKIPRHRHTMFFTATWPKEVRTLANEILHKPYKVMIGNRDELKGNQDITQTVRIVDAMEKTRAMEHLLREAGLADPRSAGKALVFCNTKRMCEQLSNQLARGGLPCTSIHGDKDQTQRDDALNGLKNGRFKVLVATDVAARGLDIKGVGLVVNFDPANNTEDYVHRIGRTGRAGAKGVAVTFLLSSEAHKARGIVEVMERTDQAVSDELRALAGMAPTGPRRQRGKGGGKGDRDRDRDRDRSRSRSRSRSRR